MRSVTSSCLYFTTVFSSYIEMYHRLTLVVLLIVVSALMSQEVAAFSESIEKHKKRRSQLIYIFLSTSSTVFVIVRHYSSLFVNLRLVAVGH